MCRGVLLYKFWRRTLSGIFLKDFFSTKNEEKKSGDKIPQKSGGPKIKIAKNPFCQKPTLKNPPPKGSLEYVNKAFGLGRGWGEGSEGWGGVREGLGGLAFYTSKNTV